MTWENSFLDSLLKNKISRHESTNESYTVQCYKSTTTILMAEMKKIKITSVILEGGGVKWYTSIPPYAWNLLEYPMSFQSLSQDELYPRSKMCRRKKNLNLLSVCVISTWKV